MADNRDEKKDSETAPRAAEPASNVASFTATGRGKPCPICGRPSIVEMRPFCSKRCADIDLGRWLGEAYRVPAIEQPSTADDDPETLEKGPGNGQEKP
jgi:hypothetical protein